MENDTRPAFAVAQALLTEAARIYDVEPWTLLHGYSGRKDFKPRWAVIWVLRVLRNDNSRGQSSLPYSYHRIKALLGYKDHTSVIHAYKGANKLRETDDDFRRSTNKLLRFAKSHGPQIKLGVAA